jgi:hypothetical protein
MDEALVIVALTFLLNIGLFCMFRFTISPLTPAFAGLFTNIFICCWLWWGFAGGFDVIMRTFVFGEERSGGFEL